MRLVLTFALLLAATVASAQTADTLAVLDGRIAMLDREVGQIDDELSVIRLTLRTIASDEAALDAERARFLERIRAYQDEADRHRADARRARAMYDDLVRYGGSEADRRAYDDARLGLESRSDRLRDEALSLDALNADLNARYRAHAARVRETAGRGQDLSRRRAALGYERETLSDRRARLAARLRLSPAPIRVRG